jgi:uncharacterized protein YkwD
MPAAASRPHARLLLLALAAAAVLVLAPAARADSCALANASRSSHSALSIARATVCEINRQRASHGLRAVTVRSRIARAAQRMASDMARRNYFAHVTPGGATLSDRLRQSGYLRTHRAWTVGEALGWGTLSDGTPAGMVRAWLNSPEHRAILLSPQFRDVGVGVARGVPVSGVHGSGATYAADFGVKY